MQINVIFTTKQLYLFNSRAELGVCMYQLENLVQEQLPELHVHFQSQVSSRSYFNLAEFRRIYESLR